MCSLDYGGGYRVCMAKKAKSEYSCIKIATEWNCLDVSLLRLIFLKGAILCLATMIFPKALRFNSNRFPTETVTQNQNLSDKCR